MGIARELFEGEFLPHVVQARRVEAKELSVERGVFVGAKGVGQGVVAWDVEVTNQDGDVVASYDILTLVAKRG